MIKVEIFVNPNINIDKIGVQLAQIGIKSLSAIDMRLFGKEHKTQTSYRGVQRASARTHKVKLEIILPQENKKLLYQILRDIIGPEQSQDTQVFTSSTSVNGSITDSLQTLN